MKSDYINRAIKLINKIYPYINVVGDIDIIRERVTLFNKKYHAHVQVRCGVSRIALIYSDYVIKFNYGDGYVWAGGCEEEYQKYTNAIAGSQFAYLFAPVTKVNVKDTFFYIMPRIKGIKTSYKYYEKLTIPEKSFIYSITDDCHRENYGHANRHIVIIDYAYDGRDS